MVLFAAIPTGAATQDTLEEKLEQVFASGLAPGMSVAVVHGDQVVLSRGFGYADLERKRPVTAVTPFYIASTTKSLTALAVALLADRGEFALSDPVTTLVPGLHLHPEADSARVTVASLLTCTLGLEGWGPVVWRTAYTGEHTQELLVELTAWHAPREDPGVFEYANIGYNIAGFVLEATSGHTWQKAVSDLVFEPLALANTSSSVSGPNLTGHAFPYRMAPEDFVIASPRKTDATMHAAGGHYSTAEDMAAWIGVMLNHGRWRGEQVFPAHVIADVQRRHVEQDREFNGIQRHGWGLGWDLGTWNDELLIHRFGSYPGFRSHVSFMPDYDLGVVVLVNEDRAGSLLADSAAYIAYHEMLGKAGADSAQAAIIDRCVSAAPRFRQQLLDDRSKRAQRDQELSLPLAAYSGRYHHPAYGTLDCTVEHSRLVFRIGRLESVAEVYNAGEHQLRVELTGSGSVVSADVVDDTVRSMAIGDWVFYRNDAGRTSSHSRK
jgi:CubicO group peptidase (beta-lactamase class C family)